MGLSMDSKCGRSTTNRLHRKGYSIGRTVFLPQYGIPFLCSSDFSILGPKLLFESVGLSNVLISIGLYPSSSITLFVLVNL